MSRGGDLWSRTYPCSFWLIAESRGTKGPAHYLTHQNLETGISVTVKGTIRLYGDAAITY